MTVFNSQILKTIAQQKDEHHTIEPAFYSETFRVEKTGPAGRSNEPGNRFVINCNDCNENLHTVEPEHQRSRGDDVTIQNDIIFNKIATHVGPDHTIQLGYYTNCDGSIINIALECITCNLVLHDIEYEHTE